MTHEEFVAGVQRSYDGVEMTIRENTMDDEICKEVFEDCYRIKSQFKSIIGTPGVIVDIGGHIGSFTAFSHALFPDARHCVLEPEISNFELCTKNVGAYSTVIRAAAGTDGDNLMLQLLSTRTMERNLNTGGGNAGDGQVVPCRDCDAVLSIMDCRPDIMKVDCEGGEYNFFRNQKRISEIPFIFGEWHLSAGTQQQFAALLIPTHNIQFSMTFPHGGLFWAIAR